MLQVILGLSTVFSFPMPIDDGQSDSGESTVSGIGPEGLTPGRESAQTKGTSSGIAVLSTFDGQLSLLN